MEGQFQIVQQAGKTKEGTVARSGTVIEPDGDLMVLCSQLTLDSLQVVAKLIVCIRAFQSGVQFFWAQGADVAAMRLIGGGARGRLWNQILADAYGVVVRFDI